MPETGQLPIKLDQMLKGNSAMMDKARCVCYYMNSKVDIFVLLTPLFLLLNFRW